MKPRSIMKSGLPLATAITALLTASQAHAQLTWDANGTGALQTDGAGVWLTANQWWNGSANATWSSGSAAVFGNGGAGGAVTLASATTVASLTFNSFTGTYTLGTTTSTITLNGGITKNTGAGAATIISPITLGAAQSWNNNSLGLLTIGTGAVTNAGFLLTLGGTGNTTVSSVISGAGGLTKSDAGLATLSGANTYGGATTINGGVLAVSTLANGGSTSAIGNSANAAANLVFGAPTATLRHTGAAASTNRGFTLSSGAGGGATIEASGTGALTFDNTVAIAYGTANETRALTLGGTSTNENNFGKVLADNGSGATSLVKAGAGTWVLNATNTYTGGSTINTGALVFRTLASKSATGTHAFAAGTTIGLGVASGGFTTGDVDNAFSAVTGHSALAGNLSNVTVTSTTSVGIDTTAASLIYSTNIGAVTKGLTKFGGNTLTLSGTNSGYTGATTITGGTLSIASVANAGSSSSIGAFATTSATGLILNNATTLTYTGATASTNRGFTVNGSATINVATPGAKLTLGDFTMANAPALTVSGGAGSSLDLGTFTFSTPTNQSIAANIPVSIASIASTVAQEIRNSGSALMTVGNYTATAGTFFGGGQTLITGTVTLGGAFTNTQTGTITYTGNSFSAPQLSIWAANTFAVGGSGTIGTLGTFANLISFRENGTFQYNSSANQTLSGGMSMNSGTISNLNMSGSGTLTLTGTNSANSLAAATGVTTVSNGILQYGRQVSLYNNVTASWTAAKINVKNGGTLAFNVGGTGEFTTGDVTTLLTNLAASSSATNGMNAGSRLGFDTTTATGGTFTIANVIADTTGANGGARGLTKLGTGTLVNSNTNTYTGPTTLSGGTLSVGSIGDGGVSGNLGAATNSAANIVFDGGTLKYTGANVTTDRAFTINTGKTATIDTANDISFAGATGAATTGALTKTGAGALTLTGTNTYTGTTAISAGTLVMGDGAADTFATSSVTVSSTATLKGNGTISGTVSVNGTSGVGNKATHAPGTSVGKQTVANDLSYGEHSIFEWELASNTTSGPGTNFDAVDVTGVGSDLAINAASVFKVVLGTNFDSASAFWTATQSWNVFDVAGAKTDTFQVFQLFNASAPTTEINYTSFGTFSYGYTGNTGILTWTAVPEPSSALVGLLIGAGLLRRRR